MTDPVFVAAGYMVVVGGVAAYALALRRRLAKAKARTLAIRAFAEASGAPVSDVSGSRAEP